MSLTKIENIVQIKAPYHQHIIEINDKNDLTILRKIMKAVYLNAKRRIDLSEGEVK